MIQVLVSSFNDIEGLEKIIKTNKDDLAAMIIEPVIFNSGCILPEKEYLTHVRELTKRNNIVLIFDEIITGFRLAPGGAQEYFGIMPDISVFAKAIANGYPLSAVVGRKDMMEMTRPGDRVMYGGTYNGQQAALAAATICLDKIKNSSNQEQLCKNSKKLKDLFHEECKARNVDCRLQECGGEFQVYFTDKAVKNYRDAFSANQDLYRIFYKAVLEKNIWFSASSLFHHGVCLAHGENELKEIIDAFKTGLDAVEKKMRSIK